MRHKTLIVPVITGIILMGGSISWSEPDRPATAAAGARLSFLDSDGDGIVNTDDNCVTTPNVLQRDTDADGIGNYCDADLNNDCAINFIDLGIMRSVFDGFDPHADMNGDGVVNNADFDISRLSFFGAPGPSGLPNACAPHPQNPRFMYPGPYAFGMGEKSESLAIADLNADGALDLVTTYAESDSVAVLLGIGDGSFKTPLTFAVGEKPLYAAIADLNADGVPDLATANSMSHDVSVLLGNGDGNFQPTGTIRVGNLPTTIAIADLNADERPDLVTANRWSDDVSVLLGNGDGSFQTPLTFSAADQAFSVAIGDLNADSAPDLVVTSFSSHVVAVLLGDGDGSFQAPLRFGAGHTPRTVVIADFNADGVPDLAIANHNRSFPTSDQYVSVLLGNGDGSFQTAVRFAVGNAPQTLATGDFNTDGVLDLVTANYNSNDLSILLGNGDGSFQTALTLGASIGVRRRPISVAVADLNTDDAPDIVMVTRFSAQVYVWQGNGDGSFQTALRVGAGDALRSVVIADLNADDAPDLVAANPWSDEVSVLPGNGDGSFQTPLAFGVGDQPRSVAIADLNADDVPDLVTANYRSDDVTVLLGNGDGSFQAPLAFGVGDQPHSVAIADLNADDAPDLVIAKSTVGGSVLLGNGDGTFQTALQAPGSSGSVAIADLNTDGIPDLVTHYRVALGNGDGSFQPPLATGASNVESIAIADVNADGIPDLATANAVYGGLPDAGVVSIQLGNGDGTFQLPHEFDAGRGPVSVAIADVNVDGIPDLVNGNVPYDDPYVDTGDVFSGAVTVLLGNGNGTFQAPLAFAVGRGGELAIGDLNADDMPDVVVVNSSSDYVSVLLHRWSLPE